MNDDKIVLEEGEHMDYLHSLLVFALFEDVLFLAVKPQVTFASLSSPAVMDIRRLRRRSLEKIID